MSDWTISDAERDEDLDEVRRAIVVEDERGCYVELGYYDVYALVCHQLGDGLPLRCLEVMARAYARGRDHVGARELAAQLGQTSRDRLSNGQANRLCELGLLTVVDGAPRSYRLLEPEATLAALCERLGRDLRPPQPRTRISPLGA